MPPFLHVIACIFLNLALRPSHHLGRSKISNPYLHSTPSKNSPLESSNPLTSDVTTYNYAPVDRARVAPLPFVRHGDHTTTKFVLMEFSVGLTRGLLPVLHLSEVVIVDPLVNID